MIATAAPPVLQLDGVTKRYGSKENPVFALRGIDLQVAEGEYVAIIGPSGSGKSTLLNILGCLDRPSEGEYRLSGKNVAELDDRQLSRLRNRHIGFVFQSFHLVSHLTVIENIELPLFYARKSRAERRQRCYELAERVGLGHRTDHVPNELSGGECQRAAVARALSINPSLILADEPTGNLDSKTTRDILGLFEELHANGRTLVLITHDLEIAAAAPRCVALRDGSVESDQGTSDS